MFNDLINTIEEYKFICYNTVEVIDNILYLYANKASDYMLFREVIIISELIDVQRYDVNFLDDRIMIERK